MARLTPRPVAVVAVMGLLGIGILVSQWGPSVPGAELLPLLVTTTLQGDMTPDVREGVDPETLPRSPSGGECLPRIDRPAGPLDLCWQAYRDPHDGDPQQDYYVLRVYGSFGGETGTGVRWVSVRARLVGQPSSNVFEGWPDSTYDGGCADQDVSLNGLVGPVPREPVCGRTTGATTDADWSHLVTWTCIGCIVVGHETRPIILYSLVAVPERTVPAWEIFGDLGGD
jgi:hypothetical protein